MAKARPRDRYIQVGNIRTRYWALGEGDSIGILLHGLGGYIENWEDNIAALSQRSQVYALDLAGFGRSEKPRIRYTLQYLVKFIREFMNRLEIDKAALIGASLGGMIALQLAVESPQLVEKLVLAASGGMSKEVSLTLRILSVPLLGDALARPSRAGSEKLMQEIFNNHDLITDDGVEEDYEISSLPGAQHSLLSALRSICNLWGVRSEVYKPILNRLGEIEAPSLVIWGAQDRILPVAHAHRAIEGLPNARLHIFDPCGHLPNIERVGEFNELVAGFLSVG